jgi:uncharacterized membrane protein YeaQ/YmgE (transglycosylase-associated protein family)
MNVGSFIAALLLGFVAGAIARALIPRDAFRHLKGWRSWLTSTVLGLAGAVVGFWVFHGIFGIGDTHKFDWGGIIGAVIGALIVVALASWAFKRITGRDSVVSRPPRGSGSGTVQPPPQQRGPVQQPDPTQQPGPGQRR